MVAGTNPERRYRPHITVRDLTMAYGSFVLMRDLNFTVNDGDVFIIMGGSGCGKSTLLRHMIGLIEPAKGEIFYGDENFTKADSEPNGRRCSAASACCFRAARLWSSMTLAENIGMPAGRVHRFESARDPRGRVPQARAGRPQGIRRLLPVADQRRHAEASRLGARHGARSRGACSSTSRRRASIRSARGCSTI